MKTKEMIYAMILILICFLVFSYKILNTQNEINKKLAVIAEQLQIDIINIEQYD
jgi:cell division protein FtsL